MTGAHRRQRHLRRRSAPPSGRRRRALSPRHRGIRAGLVVAAVATMIGVAVAAETLPLGLGSAAVRNTPSEQTTTAPPAPPERTSTSPSPGRASSADQLPTAPVVPTRGSGRFAIVPGTQRATGRSALTYTVEVERELEVDRREFAALVDATLAHRKGWRAVGDHEFQRVESDPQTRILLTTPGTVDKLCAPLKTRGELSCRNRDLVVINAKRWALGADAYRGPLTEYRRYVVNHEVGHALGYSHRECPQAGTPAPVMLQQTIGLDGCAPNPWPIDDPGP